MKNYITPHINILTFETENVLTISNTKFDAQVKGGTIDFKETWGSKINGGQTQFKDTWNEYFLD